MIVDCHTHVMWYPDHLSQPFAEEALASKLVKLQQSGGEIHSAHLDLHSYDSKPEEHWAAAQAADRVIVFGLQARAAGIWVPNEVIADYVRQHPDKLIGWASVDPNEPDCIEQLRYAVETLGLRGLKLGPVYQHWDPQDPQHWPLLAECQRFGIPVLFHQGTTFPSRARLRWGNPLQLEDLAMEFPDLRIIIAHLGHPWEEDTVALIRKAPNVWADISAVHYRPWRYWQAMVTAMEYGVTHKLLLASDFPSATIGNVITGLRNINRIVEGTQLPKIPTEIQERIISDTWRDFFTELEMR